jgi:hypothetical protein
MKARDFIWSTTRRTLAGVIQPRAGSLAAIDKEYG